ncbi:MAG: hypothetical protein JO247_19820 [Chloroflexi bacterium]|nr:hypothetical protein [Chloroflexota bacterium]
MRIKGVERERKQRKRREAMRVDNAGVRRIQLALIQRALGQVYRKAASSA